MDPTLYAELKEIRKSLTEIEVTLARNTDSLEYHIKRSDMLEQRVSGHDKDLIKVKGFISISAWVLGISGTIVALFSQIIPLLK